MLKKLVNYFFVFIYSCLLSIKLKKKVKAHGKVSSGNFHNITVGEGVVFNDGVYLQARGPIYIGNRVVFSRQASIYDAGLNFSSLDYDSHVIKSVAIGDDCWIGAHSIILPGVILGNNVIVAAGSVVVNSFKDGAVIIAGNPARIVKGR